MSGNDQNDKEMLYTNAEAVAEAMIFAAGESVALVDIANVLMLSREDTEAVMEKLMTRVNGRNGGVILRKMDDSFRFCSRPDLHECMRVYFERPQSQNLSRAASETLAVIAYMQPVTRAVIESVRGVNSDSALTRLLERELVCEKGKADTPGRPILYGTTELFLQSAGLSSLDDLPKPAVEEDSKNIEQMDMFSLDDTVTGQQENSASEAAEVSETAETANAQDTEKEE